MNATEVMLLGLPALGPEAVPPGADTTMTTSSPDQAWFIVVAVFCTVIPAFFLSLRIYTKFGVVKSLELADYFLFLAFPLLIAEIGVGAHMIRWGAGVHQWQVTVNEIFHQLYWANVGQVIYCPLSYLVKMAILLQYLRLFAPSRSVNKIMWFGAWLTIAVTSIMYTIFFWWTLFSCTPRRKIWDKLIPYGHCHSVSTIVFSQGAFNMITDLIVLILPTSTLWQLRVPRGRKILITIMFGTGLLACIASLMRIVFTLRIDEDLSKADVSENALFIGLWTHAETSLGFIVGCSLSLPKLIQTKGHKLRQSFSKAASFSSSRSNLSPRAEQAEYTEQRRYISYERVGFSEDPEALHQVGLARLQPVQQVRDAYVLPSPLESSKYSHSIYSQGNTCGCPGEEHSCVVDPIYIVRPEILRSISMRSREVPIRWDRLSVPAVPPLPQVVEPLPEESLEEINLEVRSPGAWSLDEKSVDIVSIYDRSLDDRSSEERPLVEMSPYERSLVEESLDERSLHERSPYERSFFEESPIERIPYTRSLAREPQQERSPYARSIAEESSDERSLHERSQDEQSQDERSQDERSLDESVRPEERSLLPELSFGAFDIDFYSESWTELPL